MYIPPSNAEPRVEAVLDFVEAHPFAALVTTGPDGLFATHLPLALDRSRGEHGVLRGHVARANPHPRRAAPDVEALVVFAGPDAYVTPAWYPSKAEHGEVVPTWNYVAVHAYGRLAFTEDPGFLRAHLRELTERSERGREHPWSVEDAPAEYLARLERAIVGLEIEVTRWEGKWKMSQNRPGRDIDGVVRGLSASPDPRERAVAEIVAARRPVGA